MSKQSDDKSLRVNRRGWFLALVRRYVRRRLRKSFDGVYVRGLERVREQANKRPLLLAANHVCWWDAFLAVTIDEALGTESYCLMDADNLRRLPFFGWIGAIELDRAAPRQSLRDLKASAQLLDVPGRALWIFPQGEHRPPHVRPLGIKRGVEVLWRAVEKRHTDGSPEEAPLLVPVATNYLFRDAPEPTIAISLGEPFAPNKARSLISQLDAALVAELSAIDRFVCEGDGDFSALIPPRTAASTPAAAQILATATRHDNTMTKMKVIS